MELDTRSKDERISKSMVVDHNESRWVGIRSPQPGRSPERCPVPLPGRPPVYHMMAAPEEQKAKEVAGD